MSPTLWSLTINRNVWLYLTGSALLKSLSFCQASQTFVHKVHQLMPLITKAVTADLNATWCVAMTWLGADADCTYRLGPWAKCQHHVIHTAVQIAGPGTWLSKRICSTLSMRFASALVTPFNLSVQHVQRYL